MILYDLCCASDGLWTAAAREDGFTLRSYGPEALRTQEQQQALLASVRRDMAQEPTAVLYSNHNMIDHMEKFIGELPGDFVLVPMGSDALAVNPGTVGADNIRRIHLYQTYGGEANIRAMFAFLRSGILCEPGAPEAPEPEKTPFDGIYDVETLEVFQSPEAFFVAENRKFPHYIGMLSHRSVWQSRSLAAEAEIVRCLEKQDIGVIPVFCAGETGERIRSFTFSEIVEHYFKMDGRLLIDGLINFQMHLVKGENGKTVAETSMERFEELGVPVFKPITSYFVTPEKWREDPNPLSQELPTDYLNPEMAGMIEPVLISLRRDKSYVAVPENVELLAKRIRKWVDLRTKPNSEKKITLMLHNDVCSGVEATIGKAFGLDVFESTVRLMKRLQEEGYAVENIPENGRALRDLILRKKAISDFRWTSVEDIVEAGGCLYKMPVHDEYLTYFREFTPNMQQDMLDHWGPAPGEGMVMGDRLIITGIEFGNVTVMVQPKRGCYGAKCTGEVCRILHDPACPPAHQYIAAYRYLERVAKMDAVVHMGTDGSLEYLPGRGSGLGAEDWSYAVLGGLPNLYPYHPGVPSEGTIAKRRANAVLVGYYPASSAGLSPEDGDLLDALRAYSEAYNLENGQAEPMERALKPRLASRPRLQKLLDTAGSFYEGAQMAAESLLKAAEARKITKLHVLGENPGEEEKLSYLSEVLRGDQLLPRKEGEDEYAYGLRLQAVIQNALSDAAPDTAVTRDIRQIYGLLEQTAGEQDRLVELLSGGYQRASESGMPDENGRNILPSGRNFYMMNLDKIPTPTAYRKGMELADQLLEAYRRDEGKYPKKIAMNMISLDISRTQGEQMCQFMNLMGIRPRWDSRGRVLGLEAIPVSELGHPRIDITLRISGVMRDTWPDAVELLDEAVLLATQQDESEEENYLLYNIHKMEAECGELGDRSKTIRIFGDPPGAFGAGVDLALKASAWQSDRDLARYFIQSSAYAYGKGLSGRRSIREFVQNARNVELTTDVSTSRRMDTLSCGFGLQVHGGFKLLSKTIGGNEVRQYQSVSEVGAKAQTGTLQECVERDIRQTLLNPVWQENTMAEDYTGASEMMIRIQNVFDAQCTSEAVADTVLDELAQAYVNDEDMRSWLLEKNPYAAEEIGRRLLELESRGKWKPDEEVLEKLRENYLSVEGFMEGGTTGSGEIQGGTVEIIQEDQVEIWKQKLADVDEYLRSIEG